MHSALIAGSGLRASRLSFGTASLHHLAESRQRSRLIAAALDAGFTHFDTAPYYGFGFAEAELGRHLPKASPTVTVASKIGLYPRYELPPSTAVAWTIKALGKLVPGIASPVVDWSLDRCDRSLERSLMLLRRDCLDILFLH